MRSLARVLGVVVAWLLHAVLPLAAAAAGFLGGAKLTSSTAGLVVSALLASAAVGYGTGRLAMFASRRTRGTFVPALVSVALAGLLLGLLLFRRPPVPSRTMPTRSVAFEHLQLASGSHVAVARIPATNPSIKTPLLFLHGGPGGYIRDSDLALLRSIASSGVEVIAFDQAGGGASPRLSPHDYSLARAVADLEALRVALGAPRISLFGQSWGSMLAFEYARAHPDRVERMVLAGAGLISSNVKDFAVSRTALPGGKPAAFPPYFLAAAMLHRVNPEAAVNFLPRDELDAAFKQGAMANLGRWFCKADAAHVQEARDDMDRSPALDAYQALALKREMEARAEAPPAIPSPPPTLIIRGLCDFVPWRATLDLRDRTRAAVVTVPDVGHAMWPARADLIRDLVLAHLAGQPLPRPKYEGTADPAD